MTSTISRRNAYPPIGQVLSSMLLSQCDSRQSLIARSATTHPARTVRR